MLFKFTIYLKSLANEVFSVSGSVLNFPEFVSVEV